MKNWLTIFIVFQCLPVWAQTTACSFEIKVAGKTVGCLDVSKISMGSATKYIYHSEVEIDFFGKVNVKSQQVVIFRAGKMVSSLHEVYKNGKIHERAKTEADGHGYVFSKKGKATEINQPISFSSILLFFHKPTTVHQVFSESEGIFKKLETLGDNSFGLTASGYHTNKYFYKNGKLLKVQLHHLFGDVTVELIN